MPFTPNRAFRAEIKALDEHECWPEAYRIDIATDAWAFYRAESIEWAFLFVNPCGTYLIVGGNKFTPDPDEAIAFALSVSNHWPESKIFQLSAGEKEYDEPYFKRIR